MSDAIGGVVNIALVVFFLTVIALYMAFNVNYQRAFNVKNKIISIYEANNGICKNKCKKEIEEYETNLGYRANNITKNANRGEYCNSRYGYCISGIETNRNISSKSVTSNEKYCYFEIRTQVNIDIPIINNLMGLRLFQVTGQTSTMKIINKKSCEEMAGIAIGG